MATISHDQRWLVHDIYTFNKEEKVLAGLKVVQLWSCSEEQILEGCRNPEDSEQIQICK